MTTWAMIAFKLAGGTLALVYHWLFRNQISNSGYGGAGGPVFREARHTSLRSSVIDTLCTALRI